ncbi:MAG: penicillin-binding protein 2 [Rickettsiaceae bacterium]|nr:penicillin-binding protein 2 [Rickettsiaceae bacterium]
MRNELTENKELMTRRIFCLTLGKATLLSLLISRMFYLQFLKKDEYKTLSDKNRLKTMLLSPPRGNIYDILDKKIVDNTSCFRLLLDKNISPNFLQEGEVISSLLELDEKQKIEFFKRINNTGWKIAGLIIDSLTWQQVSILEERKSEIKSFFVDLGFKRHYRYPQSTAHVTGYLGKQSTKSKEKLEISDEYWRVGKTGLELFYEEQLRGKFGVKTIEVNAHGKYIRDLSKTELIPGLPLHLNLNLELQSKVFEYLPEKGCSVTMMNCNTGAMILYTSTPSFDPNEFYKLSNEYWQNLSINPYKPLIDKCSKSLYPPGSVFKIVTILAALENNILPDTKIFCSGKSELGSNSFRCYKAAGHGSINMQEAIQYSCNSYIFAIARKIGPNKIIEVAKKLGFGQLTGIDLPDEKEGFVPSPEWKYEKHKQRWTLGDTLNMSIGQGFLLTTPLQLTRMMAAIANGGYLLTPSLKTQSIHKVKLNIKDQHLIFLQNALHDVMNKPGGTGYGSRIKHNFYTMAAKTGTAQVRAKKHKNDDLNRTSIAWESRNHAIFSGYLPYEDPQFAITVYFDHGGGGGRSAAPIAKKIITDMLNFHS